jgi:hypothetical protein
MNLHNLSEDVMMVYLNDRFYGYTFERLGPRLITFHYRHEVEHHIMTEASYDDYERRAIEYAAERAIT